MLRIAVFPGSFDPITKGHEEIILRAIPLFDKIVVAIGINANKSTMFSIEQRMEWIEKVFENEPNVEGSSYNGLTTDYCKSIGAQYMLRGLRNASDFEYEKSIAQMNNSLNKDIETVFLMTNPKYSAINSSIVRDIIRNNGETSQFLPDCIKL